MPMSSASCAWEKLRSCRSALRSSYSVISACVCASIRLRRWAGRSWTRRRNGLAILALQIFEVTNEDRFGSRNRLAIPALVARLVATEEEQRLSRGVERVEDAVRLTLV